MGRLAGKSVVGLDIEPGYVAAVESRPGGVEVERAAAAAIPSGVVRDGEVLDVDALAGVLRDLFGASKLDRRVRIGLANQRIVMRTIDLPPLTDPKQLASAVRFQAQDHIPMPLDQAVLEHQSLGVVDTPDGKRSRVVLVAARRDVVERVLAAARSAGLRPEGIDLSAFALIRALQRPAAGPGATLYLNVGGLTNLAVAVSTLCVFTRVIGAGSESMAAELAERRALTLEHASGWLKHVGLQAPADELEGNPEIISAAREILTDGVKRIADEVRTTLDFYSMQDGAIGVERAIATGPAVSLPGFADALGERIGVPLEIGLVSEARPGGFGGIDPARLAVAAGLTVSEVAA
jgi:type IV pilus assembly protein PilM